jgi:hypothetical protein
MMQRPLFHGESAVAIRQPKTDRLILSKFLDLAARDMRLDEEALNQSHAILTKWAALEASGRLAQFKETQLQGRFLDEVFGQALGQGPCGRAHFTLPDRSQT